MITSFVDSLKRIFRLGHSKSQTSRRLEEISNGDMELKAWLKPVLDLVEIRNCKGGIVEADRANKREILVLNDSLERKTSQIEELERRLDKVERERRELIGAVSDYSQQPRGCLKHELALDTIITHLPQLSSSLAVDENRGMRIRPLTTSNHPARLESFELEDPDWNIHTFTAPKIERFELRHSEDRVGFMENDRVYRLVAADGVGGSSHGGHLAQKLCESVLLNTGGAKDAIRDELEDFSREMSGLKNGRSVSDNEEFWAQKANERGSACVLAVADVDIESGSVSGWQVGDTVVFGKYSGSNTIEVDGEELLILNESEIYGVLEA
mgnify:CR=1 FL=1